jgi:hypothetical protein
MIWWWECSSTLRGRIDTETNVHGFSPIRAAIVVRVPTWQSRCITKKALIRRNILVSVSKLIETGLPIECEKLSRFRRILNIVQKCHFHIPAGVEASEIYDFLHRVSFWSSAIRELIKLSFSFFILSFIRPVMRCCSEHLSKTAQRDVKSNNSASITFPSMVNDIVSQNHSIHVNELRSSNGFWVRWRGFSRTATFSVNTRTDLTSLL